MIKIANNTDGLLGGYGVSGTSCFGGCFGTNKSFNPNNISNITNELISVEYGIGTPSIGIGSGYSVPIKLP